MAEFLQLVYIFVLKRFLHLLPDSLNRSCDSMDSSPVSFTTPDKPTTTMSPMAPVKAKKIAITALTPPSTPRKQGHDPSSFLMDTPVKGKNYTKSSQSANVTSNSSKKDTNEAVIKKHVKKSLVGPFASRFLSHKYHEWIVYRDFNKSRGGDACTFKEYLEG